MSFPWLTVIAAVPLVGAVAVALLPSGRSLLAKQVALAVSLVPLVLTIIMSLKFDSGSGAAFQFTENHDWIPQFGVSYALGVDGIGLVLIALTAVLTPVCLLASWHDAEEDRRSAKAYFALMLMLEAAMIGVFAATDVFLFYVLFEAMLIPMYFIIGSYGGAQRSYAAVKFLLYSLFGGLLMLAAVIGLFVVSKGGDHAFLLQNLVGTHFSPSTEKLLFLGFFAAFAVKAPLWPLHTWLPDAAAEAPPGGAVLLVGVMDKVGTFGMIRLCLPLFPDASKWAAPVVITLAVIGILYGALLAIAQTDLKRLIAYTSISHFGFITLGIFAMTTTSQSGSTLYMVNHGFSTAALFLVIGFLTSRRGTRLVSEFGGVQKVAPVLAGVFLFAGLSALSLPGLSSFVSEFRVLAGTFSRYPGAAIVSTLAIVLAALYILIMYQRTMTGPLNPRLEAEPVRDLSGRERLAMAPLVLLIIVLGVFPRPVLDAINPAVEATMTRVGVSDPQPRVSAEGGR